MARKSKANPDNGRHQGKYTGYELRDGKYFLAPTHKDAYDAISHEKNGVDELVATVSAHASKQYARLSGLTTNWWKRVIDDLGLPAEGVSYNFIGGYVFLTPKKEEAGDAPPKDATA